MIRIEALSRRFGSLCLFENFDMEFAAGKVTALLGPSGCGKTTLLNILAGIETSDSGRIIGVDQKRISYLFQEPRLIPWRTVRQNLSIVLEGAVPLQEIPDRVMRTLNRVGMGDFADAYPAELSGGMRQRAVIARAFAYPGEILLMDEPLQALDLARKLDLAGWFLDLWGETRPTTIFVTHDIQEALVLGDRITILSNPPATVIASYENPLLPGQRRLSEGSLMQLEASIYKTLLDKGD